MPADDALHAQSPSKERVFFGLSRWMRTSAPQLERRCAAADARRETLEHLIGWDIGSPKGEVRDQMTEEMEDTYHQLDTARYTHELERRELQSHAC